ncbi:proteasome maturation factor UMP1-domain-containing protein [Umbelopsis sp. AD052]|nr:proteasome maturation factor UMP1-domain-containing protein [Umbelopsis sp. AD052]
MSLRIVPATTPDSTISKSTQETSHSEFGGHDTLRHGIRSIATEVLPSHPLESHLTQWKETQDNLNLQLARQVYGMHAPIRMMMNRQIATEHMRNSLLSENSLAMDVLTGNDETIDFDDILRDRSSMPDLLDNHSAFSLRP